MTIATIEQSVARLTARVRQLHNGDFVSLSFHGGAWHCSTCFTGIRSGAHKTPQKALAAFIDALSEREVSAGEARPIERSA